MPSDLEIAQAAEMLPIAEIAQALGLSDDDVDLYRKYKAKISLNVLTKLADTPNGKYVVVSSITPTPQGEGKLTTSIGLAMALQRLGNRAAVCLRQPSLGPVFGIKGGAAGGGYSQVLPMEDINLHLTGDTHAVTLAHNLLAAFVDNHLFHEKSPRLDPYTVALPRVVDINDRALRKMLIGFGGREYGIPRESSFDIAPTSEVMAILALTTSLRDLRARLGHIVVGFTRDKKPITADDLQCAGAMSALLKEALKPNLLQTIEHTPAFIHTGAFASFSLGTPSILADQIALKLNDYVITEAGFGSDLGLEKFCNIKSRYSGLQPDAAVIVATVRALKMHGGIGRVVAGQALPEELAQENLAAVERGCANLIKHIENAQLFGLPVVVAVNRFASDTDREIAIVERIAREAGAEGAFVSDAYARGGAGAISLAAAVARACAKPSQFKFLYATELPIKDKIERIAEKIYGADGVEYFPEAEQKIKLYTALGFDKLPICMAKTHLSLSHDETLKGRPRKFKIPIRDLRAFVGAGFLTALCGDLRTMPALPRVPAGTRIDVDENGKIVGLI
ncbi:MAG: formate--tetrahydrofolate ligase [Chloroflexi bacterium]|nr:formate--tetrahydrofolate ligase [Chloroflexota bacterium]